MVKNYTVEITNTAENDLLDISNYISKELFEPKKAKQVLFKIANDINNLEQMPKRNPLVKDERLALNGIRYLFVTGYIIFYTISEKRATVTIIRILYKRRNWIELL